MKTKILLAIAALALIGLGFLASHLLRPAPTAPEEVLQPPLPAPAKVVVAPAPTHYPIVTPADAQSPSEALPALAVSDTAVRNSLIALLTDKTFNQFFQASDIIHRMVVTIDNLPRENVSAQLIPLKPVGGQFRTQEDDKNIYLDSANYERYRGWVELIKNLDTPRTVALYKYFYPLFQQQYQELGYPDGYFNDRLVAVIDYLINFQEVTTPVQLVQKHIVFQYADPDQEKMAAGGKLLTRMGHDNATVIKNKLREIRAEIIK